MAQIDPNIAMGFRPIQIESPINQMAAISQLENARQQQQMNMLQMQEYARKAREDQDLASQRNALAQIHSNLPPGVKIGSDQYLNLVATKAPRFLADIMDQQTKREGLVALREEREARTEERQFQLGQKKEELSRTKIKQAIADIADFDDLDSINADIDRKITSGELSQDQAAQIRSKLPADNAGVPAWQRQTLLSLMDLKDRVTEQAKLKESTAPKWELRKVGEREILVDTNPKSATVGQMKPGVEPLVDTTPKPTQIKVGEAVFYRDMNPNSPTYGTNIGDVFVDEEPKWELKTVGNKQMLVDTNPRSPTVGQMKPGTEALVDKAAKYTARDIGGKIVYVDENPDSPTFGQQKTDAALIKTAAPVAEKPEPKTEAQKNYDAAVAGGYPGTFADFLDQQRESADEREWRKAVKKGEFKGTFLQWKQALRPVSTTINQPAPTVTMVLDPADPTRMLSINAREYRGGSLGSPGVIGIVGKEPTVGKKQEAKEAAQDNAGNIIAQLRQSFDRLDQLGGITSTQNKAGTNVLAGLSSSGFGQATGRLLGTEVQSERNKIQQTRPLLMTTIMQAMGISAKQLDSNAELKLWLSAATDPTLDLQANKSALANLERMLTNKNAAAATPKPATTPNAPTVGTIKDGYRFKGGNPADKNNWEKVK
jgi:hypothetical protein